MSIEAARRPFPWPLLLHWSLQYLFIWCFLALIIFIVQTVLSYMLHDREDVMNFLKVIDRAPKFFKALIGGDELMPGNVNGVVAIGYQHPLVLIVLMINAVTTPTGLLTAEADRGTMELLLARPITRGRVFAIAAGITFVGQAALVAVLFLGTVIWTRVFDYGTKVDLWLFFLVSVNVTAIALAVAGISILVAVFFNERPRAIGVVVGYLVVSYLLNFTAVFLPRMRAIHPYTLFYYCIPNGVLRAGALPWGHVTLLLSIAFATTLAGFFIWRRKDLAAA
ncbi:ABC transporter permease subunit [Candidatus Sumerlaeota bacterium]|nr:ABC transporter permease subunit [Candidatus Sumerlaeota bacterium]